MDTIPVGRAVLRKVVDKLGGADAAALQLGISPWTLSSFLNGAVTVPDVILLRAVDIVLDDLQGFFAVQQPSIRVQS